MSVEEAQPELRRVSGSQLDPYVAEQLIRVLEEGAVEKGNALIRKKRDPHGLTISFANRIYHHERKNVGAIEKALAVPSLSESWRHSFLELREKCK